MVRYAVVDHLRRWKPETPRDMVSDTYVRRDPRAEPVARKRQQQLAEPFPPAAAGRCAPQAPPVTPRHEVTRASATLGLQKEQTVGANGLIAVVLDDDWLSLEEAQGQRQ